MVFAPTYGVTARFMEYLRYHTSRYNSMSVEQIKNELNQRSMLEKIISYVPMSKADAKQLAAKTLINERT